MKKQRSKLKKWKKAVIIVLCIILVPIITIFTFGIVNTVKSSKHSVTTEVKENEYFDFEKSDIKQAVEGTITITPITAFNGNNIREKIKEKKDFSFTQYYDLDTVLEIMENTQITKTEDISLLNDDNNIDADKLYNMVLHNNEIAKQKTGNDRLNPFYSDAEPEEIKKICDLTAKTINETTDDKDMKKIASVLARLKIFRHNTSSALAGVTQDITFFFNPTMIDMIRTSYEVGGRNNKDYDEELLTFVHEIEHLKQYCANDDNRENGTEAGFCRRYDNAKVNSLWDQWILEAAAEMKMTEYLNTTAMNYFKKITYVNSYNLGYVFDDNTELDALIDSTFETDLDSVYKKLGLNSEDEQREFLNLMYSIEISQYDCDDFWEYYQEETGTQLSQEERTSLRMDIRTQVIYNLTEKYYNNLINGIEKGTIQDLETAFYMMKIWELDCCGHLSYTQKEAFKHAEDFLVYLDEIHDLMFRAFSESTGKSVQEIVNEYKSYHPLITENGTEKKNYRFNNLSEEKTNFIESCFSGYSVTYFSDVDRMIDCTAE